MRNFMHAAKIKALRWWELLVTGVELFFSGIKDSIQGVRKVMRAIRKLLGREKKDE